MDLTIFTEPQQGATCGDLLAVARRAEAIGRDLDDDLRVNGLTGTVDEARERLAGFAEVGIERAYLQVLDLSDLDHLDELAMLGE